MSGTRGTVLTHSEAISVDRSTMVQTQSRVESLVNDRVARTGEEVRELDGFGAFVDDEPTHWWWQKGSVGSVNKSSSGRDKRRGKAMVDGDETWRHSGSSIAYSLAAWCKQSPLVCPADAPATADDSNSPNGSPVIPNSEIAHVKYRQYTLLPIFVLSTSRPICGRASTRTRTSTLR